MTDDTTEVIHLLREIRDLLAGGHPGVTRMDPGRSKRKPVARGRGRASAPDAPETRPIEKLIKSRSNHRKWEPVWEHGKPLDRWLACLAVTEEELGSAAALTAADIGRLLVDRFRVAGVHVTNINRDLRNARRFVNRSRGSNGYEHTLNRKGIAYIESRRDELAKKAKAPT